MIATLLCYFFYLFTRRTIVNKSKSGRQAIQVDRVIGKYRPVSDHKANVSTLIFSRFLFNHNGMHTLCNTIHAHDILEWKSKSCISGYPCNLETSLKSLFFFHWSNFLRNFLRLTSFWKNYAIQCSPVCLFKVVTFPFLTDWTRKEKERRRKESSRRWRCCQSIAFQCIWKTSIL